MDGYDKDLFGEPLYQLLPPAQAALALRWFTTGLGHLVKEREETEPLLRNTFSTEEEIQAMREATDDLKGLILKLNFQAREAAARHLNPTRLPAQKPAPRRRALPVTGSACDYCGEHCHVLRRLPGGQTVRMATCEKGAAFDRSMCDGYDWTNTQEVREWDDEAGDAA